MEKITQHDRPIEPTGGDNIYLPAHGKRNGKISMQHLGIYAREILKCFWQLKLNVTDSEQRTMIRSCNGNLRKWSPRNILVEIPIAKVTWKS